MEGKIETRTWHTNYRGHVLICASKKWYTTTEVELISGIAQMKRIPEIRTRLEGMAIGIGILVDCRPMSIYDEDSTYVKYKEGLYCHVYEDVEPIVPFPWKGTQGWKTVTDSIKEKIKFLSDPAGSIV